MKNPIDCGTYFGKMLQDLAVAIWNSDFERDRNPGAPFRFGENHLRKAAKGYVPPLAWPRLGIERHLSNDIGEDGRPHGGVDYFLEPVDEPNISDIRHAVATCEVGGPTRPALLRGSRANWYPKIVEDLRKQTGRARVAPAGQHYLGLFVNPARNSDVKRDFDNVLQSMLLEVPAARVTTSHWGELQEAKNLNIVVLHVTNRKDLRS
jgi:hypothetical protein